MSHGVHRDFKKGKLDKREEFIKKLIKNCLILNLIFMVLIIDNQSGQKNLKKFCQIKWL